MSCRKLVGFFLPEIEKLRQWLLPSIFQKSFLPRQTVFVALKKWVKGLSFFTHPPQEEACSQHTWWMSWSVLAHRWRASPVNVSIVPRVKVPTFSSFSYSYCYIIVTRKFLIRWEKNSLENGTFCNLDLHLTFAFRWRLCALKGNWWPETTEEQDRAVWMGSAGESMIEESRLGISTLERK